MHIDWWTLALQTVNFLILVWLLSRFLYRPVSRILAERRATAQTLLEKAKAAGAKVEAERAEIDAAKRGFAAERERILAKARSDGEAERKALLEKAQKDADAKRAQADAELARAHTETERALAAQAEDLAVTIAERLLARLSSHATNPMFVDELVELVRALSPRAKATLASAPGIEITTAMPLAPAEQEELRRRLESELGRALAISFRSDGTVIAGIELSGADVVLRNSWREDLRRVKEELARDGSA